MSASEFLVLVFSIFIDIKFLKKWYQVIMNAWPKERIKLVKYFFGWLPLFVVLIIAYTLRVLASFDVVNDLFYIIFYILLGLTWMALSSSILKNGLDLSWIDDGVNNNNPAALISISSGILGLVIIYAGANIGDGPGWWCVILAGGLGLGAFYIIALLINKITNIFEHITIDRNIGCGIRLGFYFIASGIILARASAGDWTSFYDTIIEFSVFWVIFPLTVLFIISELLYKKSIQEGKSSLVSSIIFGLIYVAYAIITIFLLPDLPQNPIYNQYGLIHIFGGLI